MSILCLILILMGFTECYVMKSFFDIVLGLNYKNDIMTLNDRITLVEGRTRKQCNSNGDRYTGEYPGPHTLQGFRYASSF